MSSDLVGSNTGLLVSQVSSPRRTYWQEHRRAAVIACRVVALLSVAGIWQLFASLRGDIDQSFPSFTSMIAAMVKLFGDSDVWTATWLTVQASVIGLALCTVVGLAVGLIVASHRMIGLSTRFIVDFCRNIPSLAIIPLFLLTMGPTQSMKILVIFVVGVWPMLIQVVLGIRNVDQELLLTARSFRVPLWRRLLFIVAPAAMPYIATGIRICASVSLLLAMGTELVAAVPGLGQEMLLSQQAGDAPRLFAFIFLAGMLGAVVNIALDRLERRTLSWHHRPRAEA